MMKGGERHVVIAEDPFIIRSALHVLLAGIESEGNISPGARENLELSLKEGCNRLIFDLRSVNEVSGGISPGGRSLRVNHLGQVLVVTCDAIPAWTCHQIEELCSPHTFPGHLMCGLRAFLHALFFECAGGR